MSIAIISNNGKAQLWYDALNAKLVEPNVEVFPNISDPSEVEYILAWKANPGDFEQFPNLKAIQSLGASVSHIFDIYEVPASVSIARIVDHRLTDDMWEFVLAAIMSNLKRLPYYRTSQAKGKWSPKPYSTIAENTVTILGAGEIGLHVAKKLHGIGFKVNVWSRTKKDLEEITSIAGRSQLIDTLKETDYLVDILPLTESTSKLVDYSLLSSLKKGAYFINVGRGEQVVDNDLIRTLDEDHLSGALLDVFHEEPLPKHHPFWTHPKIQMTPHIASVTNIESSIDLVVENYLRLKRGENLLHLAYQNKGY